MPAVRPELGPTLPQLAGPRLRAAPRPVRMALAALAVLIVVLVAWALLRGEGAGAPRTVVVHEPVAVNFIYRLPFHRLALRAGEVAHVGADGQSFAVRTLRLAPYRGDAAGALPTFATGLENDMVRSLPGFVVREEGRANVNGFQGYEVLFQYRPAGRLTYGRRILLLPTPTDRLGADLLLTAVRTPAIARYDAVGGNGALKTSLRSFRFGTKRP